MNLGSPLFALFFVAPVFLYFLFLKSNRKSNLLRDKLFGQEAINLFSTSSKKASLTLILLAFVFFGISLIRPQFGFKEVIEEREGQDIIFVVDVSQSMLSKDLSPNRLGRVRFAITDLLSHLKGDRVGLISFAGVSFIESPLTYDYSTFRLFLDDLSPDLIPIPGTNLESAMNKVVQIYGGNDHKAIVGRGRSVVLFSDGEELAGDLSVALAPLKELGIRVYTVGIGSEIGAPIPTDTGYKRDRSGKVILSKLDREKLEKLATETGGAYLGGELTGVELERFFREKISNAKDKSRISGGVLKVWNEYYQLPLLIGLLLYFISCVQSRTLVLIALLLVAPKLGFAQTLKQADEYFSQGDFRKAFEAYEANKDHPTDNEAELGSAKSLYKLKRFSEAKVKYLELAEKTKGKQSEILYNLANTLTQLGEYKEAISTYELALKLDPTDRETKENLEYVKKLLKNESSSSSSSSSSSDDKNSSEQSSSSASQQNGGPGGGGQNSDQSSASNSSQSSQSSSSLSSQSNKSGGKSSNSDSSSSEQSASSEASQSSGSSEKSSAGSGKGDSRSSETSSKGADSTGSGESESTASLPSEREEMLYDSVQEDRGALRKYREEKAIEELEERQESPPEKDW